MFIFHCYWSSQEEWNCSNPSGLRLFSIFVADFYFDFYKYEKGCLSNCWTFLTPNTSKLCHLQTSLACSCCPQMVPFSSTSDFLVLGKKRWALNEPWRSVDSGCFIPEREWIPKLWGPHSQMQRCESWQRTNKRYCPASASHRRKVIRVKENGEGEFGK